jgi:hypothetical protein
MFAIAIVLATAQFTTPTWGQPPSGQIYRMFGQIPVVTLAQLDEVAGELKLSDQQKAALSKFNDDLTASRRQAFMDSQGDFDAMRDQLVKFLNDAHMKSMAMLKPEQQQRAEEIYVQVNGPTVLVSESISKRLTLTEDQITKLTDATIDNMYDAFESLMELQSMSNDDRKDAIEQLIKSRDETLLSVLNDDQKRKFEKLGGEQLDVDLDKLPTPGMR